MTVRVVSEPTSLDELRAVARGQFGDWPSRGNRSRSVEDPERRQRIVEIVAALLGP